MLEWSGVMGNGGGGWVCTEMSDFITVFVGKFRITKAAGGPSGKGISVEAFAAGIGFCSLPTKTSLFQSASVSHAALFTCPAACSQVTEQ